MAPKTNKVAFEEALNMTGFSWYNLGMFLLCSSIITGMTFELFSVSYLVPASACELQTTSTQQGLIACIPLSGVIFTSPAWGYLADTRGRKKILIISMTMSYVTATLSTFSPNWIVLSFLKLFSSASVAGAYALSVTILSECTPMSKRSALVILSNSILLMSTAIMAVIAIPVLPLKFSYHIPFLDIYFNSWRVLGLIFAFPSVISAIFATLAYESPKYLLSVGREKEAIEVLRGIYVTNTGKSGDTFKIDSLFLEEDNSHKTAAQNGFFGSVVAQGKALLRKPLLTNTILLSILFIITYICINPFLIWLPYIVSVMMTSLSEGNNDITACQMIKIYQNSIMEERKDCSMNSFAMIMVFGIHMTLAVTNVIMSVAVNYYGRKNIYILLQILAGIAALCVNSCPYWMLTGLLFILFLTGALNFGYLTTYSIDVFPTYVRATAVSLALMMGRGSAIIGINVLKQLLDYNCEYIFYIFGSLTVVGGIIGFLLPTDKKIAEQNSTVKA